MRGFLQAACVFVIAIGSGAMSFANKLEPQFNITDPAMLAQATMSYEGRDQRISASVAAGVGVGLMILGTLGLVIPVVNRLAASMTGELSDNSARTISMITIWLSVAMTLTFGVFRVNWTGGAGLSVVLIIGALLCSAATLTSAITCGWRPWTNAPRNAT